MAVFFIVLNAVVSIYMIIIFIRIILSWFAGIDSGGLQVFLSRITDPYLNWFRRFSFLKIGFLDLSPIAALGVLSLLNRVLGMLARYGRITVGIILALLLQAVWGAVSFLIFFLIIILALRLVLYLSGQNSSSPLSNIVNAISQPVLYRINRFLFRNRIVNFMTALIISIVGLAIVYFILRFLVRFLSFSLSTLPF